MTQEQKDKIEQAAKNKSWGIHFTSPTFRQSFEDDFKQGAKEVIEHPERYGLVSITPTEKQELYDILCASAANVRYYADKDKELHGVIQGLIKKFKP